MAKYNDVNSVCNSIHDLVLSSGLHCVINQTPWSSYITLRRKFVNPLKSFAIKPSSIEEGEELVALRGYTKQLEQEVSTLKNALVDSEEEQKIEENKLKETLANLHSKLENLEITIASVELDKKNQEIEILALKKEKKVKEDIINNINTGFNDNVNKLKVKIVELEASKKEAINKEKKAHKKLRQKLQKEEKHVLVNNNNIARKSHETKILPCDLCGKELASEAELEKHVVEEHVEEHSKITKLLQEHNAASICLLENVPESELILTPEEITQFGVDWKLHLEILEILGLQNIKAEQSEE